MWRNSDFSKFSDLSEVYLQGRGDLYSSITELIMTLIENILKMPNFVAAFQEGAS